MAKVVTVFGGSGFIGRHLVGALAKAGWVIRVAVRRPSQAEFLKPLGDVGQISLIRVKAQDAASVRNVVQGSQAVINLLGILYERGEQNFATVHVTAAQNIAKAAATAGAERLVHISAIGADKQAEADYARSKGAGEDAVRAAFPEATILRPSVVFGPEDNLFNLFAGLCRISPALPLIGGGHTRFQPVYVGDVAAAALRALDEVASRGRTYELGGPRIYTFKEMLQIMLRQICRRRLLIPLPFGLAMAQAALLELMPIPLLTRDQVKMLRCDNVVAEGAAGLADLGVEPTGLELILPTYLDQYRPGGRYTVVRTA